MRSAKVPASLSASQIAFSASSIERLNLMTTWRVRLSAVSLMIVAVIFYVAWDDDRNKVQTSNADLSTHERIFNTRPGLYLSHNSWGAGSFVRMQVHLHFYIILQPHPVVEACSCPKNSEARRKKLAEIVRRVRRSGKLWKEDTPYYQDALQETWLFLCQNVERYKPNESSSCSVITWLNIYLRWQLQDFRKANSNYVDFRSRVESFHKSGNGSASDQNESFEALDFLPSSPDIPPILAEVRHWAQTDADGELRRTYIRKHHDVNCQILILLRLPPESQWNTIAKKFSLPKTTISTFYKRKAWPKLREFGFQQGYLE